MMGTALTCTPFPLSSRMASAFFNLMLMPRGHDGQRSFFTSCSISGDVSAMAERQLAEANLYKTVYFDFRVIKVIAKLVI